jgi:hypothetical protein
LVGEILEENILGFELFGFFLKFQDKFFENLTVI